VPDLLSLLLILPLGVAMGVLVAAPVGPVNILCMQRAIERGAIGGIVAGLGAVIGDTLIALMAALGIAQVTDLIARHRAVVQVVGGLVLIAFGVRVSCTRPKFADVVPRSAEWTTLKDYLWDVPQTFLLTVSNPGAVLGTFAMFGIVSTFVDVATTAQALWLVAAIAAGSAMWWTALATMVGSIRHRVTEARLGQINISAGMLLILFGIVLISEIAAKRAGFGWRALSPF
jgi:threonine/homoserine/homoserine lactone efflux protein